ncbi:hypothetical protein B0H14DRAFT_2651402 [Mycena olivaceomarginata]|nr:hypothetical protein B0H14DRAFT_2651402 [Mycena olivaceomarginata]
MGLSVELPLKAVPRHKFMFSVLVFEYVKGIWVVVMANARPGIGGVAGAHETAVTELSAGEMGSLCLGAEQCKPEHWQQALQKPDLHRGMAMTTMAPVLWAQTSLTQGCFGARLAPLCLLDTGVEGAEVDKEKEGMVPEMVTMIQIAAVDQEECRLSNRSQYSSLGWWRCLKTVQTVFVGWGVIAFGTLRLSKRRTALDAIERRRKFMCTRKPEGGALINGTGQIDLRTEGRRYSGRGIGVKILSWSDVPTEFRGPLSPPFDRPYPRP